MAGISLPETWAGDAPFFVMIVPPERDRYAVVDVEERGWHSKYEGLMRHPGAWYLVRKDNITIVCGVKVFPGEQPYYVARHVGVATVGEGNQEDGSPVPAREVIAYGIGKKRVDGTVDRLWVLPSGMICTGEDIDVFAREWMEISG